MSILLERDRFIGLQCHRVTVIVRQNNGDGATVSAMMLQYRLLCYSKGYGVTVELDLSSSCPYYLNGSV
jgi:hypothetical protein